MSDDPDPFDKLIESLADGESINWEELEQLAGDEHLRRLLRQLRIIGGVADVHRSQIDNVALAQDGVRTGPVDAAQRPSAPAAPPSNKPSEDPSGPVQVDGIGRWGHLHLIRKIGEGAFGEVFHAHDTWLDHPVALKLLKPEVAQRVSASKILHEARKLARVRHANVVAVHGADRHDGRVGFWMDYIEGQTLAERVAAGRLHPGEANYVGQEVCRALTAVHHAKLVHRDVKAQNVMRASDGGRIILMDFGAGEFIDRPAYGSAGHGTPLYLAPELFFGADASVQTDTYAVGVLLYFLVTGDFPVEAATIPALADAHKQGRRVHLRDARPDLPDPFVAVVERALQHDPARRYQSAGEMLAALSGEVAPIVPRPVEPPAPAPARTERAPLSTMQRVGRAAAIVVGVFALAEVLGFIAARAFEASLRIDPAFTVGPGDYLTIGIRAFLPFVIFWLVPAAICAAVAGVVLLLRSRMKPTWARWSAWWLSINPRLLATVVFVASALSWLIMTLVYWDFFEAIINLHQAPIDAVIDLSALSPAARDAQVSYTMYSAFLSFVVGLGAFALFRLERRSEDGTVRLLKWATVAAALVIVATPAVPRRIIWDRFELVTFETRPSLVIGTRGEEFLLYAPDEPQRPQWRVRRDDGGLLHTGRARNLFDRPRTQ